MRKLSFCFTVVGFTLLNVCSLTCTAQTFSWARSMGGSNNDRGKSIAVDKSGNVYTTGEFFGTVDFNPGPGVFNLSSSGYAEVFVSKLDVSGDFVWAKQLGGGTYDAGNGIAVDDSGNVYIAGNFSGIADFDPGSGTYNLTSVSNTADIFISKLNSSGNLVWAKQIGSSDSDAANAIVIDDSGYVYTTGSFWGTVDFDPGSGIFNLTSGTSWDVFISKLDASGNFVWAKKIGSSVNDNGCSIALDEAGGIYTAGWFGGTADFDPNAGVINLTSMGSTDIFVSKLDASGNFVWAKQMGSTGVDEGQDIVLDDSANVYSTGYFNNTVDFDPNGGTFDLTSAGTYDVFISKLDSAGNFVWAKNMGGTVADYGSSLVVDSSGNLDIIGTFSGTADFDPGTGAFNLTSAGNTDVFISKLDTSGDFIWAMKMGASQGDVGISIATDTSGNIYTTGSYNGTIDCDPGAGTYYLTSYAISDIFVHKMSAELISINDLQNDPLMITICPNPTNGKMRLEYQNNSEEMKLEVYNMMSERILQQQISNELDLSNSPKGMYFVKIYEGTKICTKKIVVQ
ncbi:MAG: SBBP repeat-containing protein [Bacteroidota bacterium]|nr:SBBP repeat-containing protein [Bacteroidota bacterium]